MKKLASILLIVALIGVICCFAACGNNNGGSLADDMTTLDDKVTSMLTEGETMLSEAESDIMGDMTGNIPEEGIDSTTNETDIIEDETQTDISTTAESTTAQ